MECMNLIKKIHAGADDTCYSSILRDWNNQSDYKKLSELMNMLCKGCDFETAIRTLKIKKAYAINLLKNCEQIQDKDNENIMYDHMLCSSKFFDKCKELIEENVEDTFFSLNSFYKPEKAGRNIRHLNAFVLDFDYYKLDQYAHLNPKEFYDKRLKKKLGFTPTAVVDSGRGLYVIYAFKHCSYHMDKLYRSIMKAFFERFKNQGMDAGATLLTQVIRLPGTINSRSGRLVEILEYNDTDYQIQDFTSLLPWNQDEVKAHRIGKIKNKEKVKQEKKDISCRKPYYKDFYEDMRKLIIMRNRVGHYDGYRENLLYIVRERAIWSGYTIDESVKLALELNILLHDPLPEQIVEKTCRPSQGRNKTSFEKIIDKLKINIAEQKKMKVLKRKWIKKSEYARRKKKHKLFNLTPRQQRILERRTRVCELKNTQYLTNKEIADILEVNKSQITRDLRYINENPSKFKILLKTYMDLLMEKRNTDEFRLKQTYDRQEQLRKWIGYAKTALDYLTRELEVVVT